MGHFFVGSQGSASTQRSRTSTSSARLASEKMTGDSLTNKLKGKNPQIALWVFDLAASLEKARLLDCELISNRTNGGEFIAL